MSYSNSGSHTRNSVVYNSGPNMYNSYQNSHSNSHISNAPLLYPQSSQAMVPYIRAIEPSSTTYKSKIYYDRDNLEKAKADARAEARAEAIAESEAEINKIKQEAAAQARKAAAATQEKKDALKHREYENMQKRKADAEARLQILQTEMTAKQYQKELEENRRMEEVKRKLEAGAEEVKRKLEAGAEADAQQQLELQPQLVETTKKKSWYCKGAKYLKRPDKKLRTFMYVTIVLCLLINVLFLIFTKDLEVSEEKKIFKDVIPVVLGITIVIILFIAFIRARCGKTRSYAMIFSLIVLIGFTILNIYLFSELKKE
jgi:hypothetical protein